MVSDPRWDRATGDIHEADYRVTDEGTVERTATRNKRGWLAPFTAVLLFVATKFKIIFAAVKSVPLFTTTFTAVVSIGAYALAFSWQFAVGLVVLLFIHEMGHVFVLRRYGVPATAPVFIPFMGAFIGMKELPRNAVMEAYVGLGGPVIGSIGAMAAWGLYMLDGHTIFLVLAYIGVLLNLFNLLPVLPLDGGRIVGAVSRWIWVVGYAAAVLFLIARPNPLLLMVLLFGAPELWNAVRSRKGTDTYYQVPLGDRLSVGAIYFGLMLVLGFAMYELQHLVVLHRP
ncbi:MAG: peptidase M50 [Chloroflexi bacterium]|nr:MAG: peptidase M50 [Chloroflexota bacterium]